MAEEDEGKVRISRLQVRGKEMRKDVAEKDLGRLHHVFNFRHSSLGDIGRDKCITGSKQTTDI